ncbi:hypothetical protein ACIF8T_40230 [Streptomyces sp. NPDC085946]|uniref:hypothetical protein n=1 Tax=Streptomyces sp. NPDC085946 TaxID=3365744 RepID=UPI0037D599F4
MALEGIRELLDVREEGVCESVRARMLPLIADWIADTDARIVELRAFSAHLASVRAELSGPASAGVCGPDCGCTTSTAEAGTVPVTLSPTRQSLDAKAWRDVPVACTLGGTELV